MLLQSFGAEAEVIEKVRISLEGGVLTTASSNTPTVNNTNDRNISKFTTPILKTNKPLVENLQRALNYILNTNLVVDGLWGRLTTLAIQKFQLKNNLKADGIVGPMTRNVLNRDLGF